MSVRKFRLWLFRQSSKIGWLICPPQDREILGNVWMSKHDNFSAAVKSMAKYRYCSDLADDELEPAGCATPGACSALAPMRVQAAENDRLLRIIKVLHKRLCKYERITSMLIDDTEKHHNRLVQYQAVLSAEADLLDKLLAGDDFPTVNVVKEHAHA